MSKSRPTELLVVLPAYDDLRRLDLALAGWSAQHDAMFDIVVVNDGGDEKMLEVVEQWVAKFHKLDYLYLSPPTKTFRLAAARNHGTASRKAKRVLYVDGDCVPAADVTRIHKRYGDEHVVVVGQRKHIPIGAVPQLLAKRIAQSPGNALEGQVIDRDKRFRLGGAKYGAFRRHLQAGQVDFEFDAWQCVWGFQMSFPWQLVMNIGGSNEGFRQYGGEDQELAARAQRSGCRLRARFDSVVYHLDHTPRTDAGNNDWKKQLAESVADRTVIRNGGPLTMKE